MDAFEVAPGPKTVIATQWHGNGLKSGKCQSWGEKLIFHPNWWHLVKITISAPRGPQKAPNMTRILYVFVHGARKVLKSPQNLHFGEIGAILV